METGTIIVIVILIFIVFVYFGNKADAEAEAEAIKEKQNLDSFFHGLIMLAKVNDYDDEYDDDEYDDDEYEENEYSPGEIRQELIEIMKDNEEWLERELGIVLTNLEFHKKEPDSSLSSKQFLYKQIPKLEEFMELAKDDRYRDIVLMLSKTFDEYIDKNFGLKM